MFQNRSHIVRALGRLEEGQGPNTTSLVAADRLQRDPSADPFYPGFLSGLERREELIRLLRGLDERSQRLLFLWFVGERPVTEIAAALGISRVHCYRLRDKALDQMIEASRGTEQDVRRAS